MQLSIAINPYIFLFIFLMKDLFLILYSLKEQNK